MQNINFWKFNTLLKQKTITEHIKIFGKKHNTACLIKNMIK